MRVADQYFFITRSKKVPAVIRERVRLKAGSTISDHTAVNSLSIRRSTLPHRLAEDLRGQVRIAKSALRNFGNGFCAHTRYDISNLNAPPVTPRLEGSGLEGDPSLDRVDLV